MSRAAKFWSSGKIFSDKHRSNEEIQNPGQNTQCQKFSRVDNREKMPVMRKRLSVQF